MRYTIFITLQSMWYIERGMETNDQANNTDEYFGRIKEIECNANKDFGLSIRAPFV